MRGHETSSVETPWPATLAQLVEQGFCKAQVDGSTPSGSLPQLSLTGTSMSDSVEAAINTHRLEDEISRLRLIIGSLRDELWNQVWSGLYLDPRAYADETDRIIYGDKIYEQA